MRTHEAVMQATVGTTWPVVPLRRITRHITTRNDDFEAPSLSLSSGGFLYPRALEGEGAQAPSEATIRRSWVVRPGDLVVNPMWMAGAGLAVSDRHGSVSPDYRVYHFDASRVDPRFCHYLLRSRPYLDQYTLYTRGTTTFDRRVSKHDLDDLPVLLPPVEAQRRIANLLDVETEQIRSLASTQERVARLAWLHFLSLRAKLLHARDLAAGYLTSTGWRVSRVWLEARNHDRRRVPLNAEERGARQGEYPYYGANGVVDHIDDYIFDGKMVLVGEDGAPFFEPDRDVAWVAMGRYWVNNHAHVLEAIHLLPEFLSEVLNVVDYSKHITGSTRDKLTQDDLSAIPVPIPSWEEQGSIVRRLAAAREVVERLRVATQQEFRLLNERRQALITAAVTGQLDV